VHGVGDDGRSVGCLLMVCGVYLGIILAYSGVNVGVGGDSIMGSLGMEEY
jgi:hypothetical protein